MPVSDHFLELQTQAGWGQVLSRFRDWINPQAGWLTLDVGCGPGYLPALFAQGGCRPFGTDLDFDMFTPAPLHPPFKEQAFDLVTASNLLFLLPDPLAALRAITQLVHPGGQFAALNPSEHLTVAAATKLIEARDITGLARQSLLNWAARAETLFHWTEAETAGLFAAAGLEWIETHTTMGPDFARFGRGLRV